MIFAETWRISNFKSECAVIQIDYQNRPTANDF